MTKVRVTRDVSGTEAHNYSGRDVAKGEILYLFDLYTYNCVDQLCGVALSEQEDYPFFEFPADAIERLNDD